MTDGGARKDESVSFSLRELTKLEEERVAREQRARAEERARAAAAIAEAQRRAREEEERRIRDEEERRHARELEELARREALQRAATEQVRLEVEVRARENERERERKHELELARLRATAQASGFGIGALAGAALVGAALAGMVAFAVHMTSVEPAHAAHVAETERALATEKRRAVALGAELDRMKAQRLGEGARLDELSAELARAKAACDAAPKRIWLDPPPPKRGGSRGSKAEPSFADNCVKGDPLCGLPR